MTTKFDIERVFSQKRERYSDARIIASVVKSFLQNERSLKRAKMLRRKSTTWKGSKSDWDKQVMYRDLVALSPSGLGALFTPPFYPHVSGNLDLHPNISADSSTTQQFEGLSEMESTWRSMKYMPEWAS